MPRASRVVVEVTVTIPTTRNGVDQDRRVEVDEKGTISLRTDNDYISFHRDDLMQALKSLARTAEQDRARKLSEQWGLRGTRPGSAV